MYKIIQSNKNKYFKHVKSLLVKKYRDLTNQYLIEGTKIIKEAMSYNAKIHMLLFSSEQSDNKEISDIVEMMDYNKVSVYQVDKSIFKEISDTDTPQGIIGVLEKPLYEVKDIYDKDFLREIVLDEVSDPGNLGTIIRTADACNYDLVLLSKGCVDLYNGKSLRATMGSLFHLPILVNANVKQIINELKNRSIAVYGANAHKGDALYDIRFDNRTAIVIGNESTGLSNDSLESIESMIRIPMPGKAESLNASVAASIIMYESIR
ncbi:MAG: RNA methyltransferase [Clostridiales bacterium]|nr:RNA methyltransferase [Clostridiales bacterium]